MRYRIPENIEFAPAQESLNTGNTASTDIAKFLISDRHTKRKFFINQTTKTFIEKFNTPKTFAEVNKEIATEVSASADSIKKMIYPFFRYIKYRYFIVPENYAANKIKISPLFNPGTILDQYKIKKIIDAGCSIDIYKATDLEKGNDVVVKLLKQPGKKQIEELKKEFNFLKTLNKTGVVPKTYAFVTKTHWTYFTELFIDGLVLPQFISGKKKSTLNLIVTIAGNIINAFKKIHDKNIVHGDIHPSNILITAENKITVIDFGMAINSGSGKDELVSFGGVYFFMPPERIRKTTYKKFTRKPDFYSDVFQLGVVLYVLLYDKYPFNGITWEELATEIKEKQIEFPERSTYNFPVPEWMKNIIELCVAKKPENRFTNAHEVHNAFSKKMKDNARKIRSTIKV